MLWSIAHETSWRAAVYTPVADRHVLQGLALRGAPFGKGMASMGTQSSRQTLHVRAVVSIRYA